MYAKSNFLSESWRRRDQHVETARPITSMSSQTHYETTPPWVEYKDKVDIEPRNRGSQPPIRGFIHTHIPKIKMNDFTAGLMVRGLLSYFDMSMRPFADMDKAWITFIPKKGLVYDRAVQGMSAMMMFLSINKHVIVWKEDHHGYEIDSYGNIKRKWELEPY